MRSLVQIPHEGQAFQVLEPLEHLLGRYLHGLEISRDAYKLTGISGDKKKKLYSTSFISCVLASPTCRPWHIPMGHRIY